MPYFPRGNPGTPLRGPYPVCARREHMRVAKAELEDEGSGVKQVVERFEAEFLF